MDVLLGLWVFGVITYRGSLDISDCIVVLCLFHLMKGYLPFKIIQCGLDRFLKETCILYLKTLHFTRCNKYFKGLLCLFVLFALKFI